MKASEVLSRYTAGEREFHHADLQGESFESQDLSGADFTDSDLRGANFTNAILKRADFTSAKAGVQEHWMVAQLIISIVLLMLLSSSSKVLNTIFLDHFFRVIRVNQIGRFTELVIVLTIGFTFFAIAHRNLNKQVIKRIAIVFLAIAFAGASANTVALASDVAIVIAVAITIIVAVAVTDDGAAAAVAVIATVTAMIARIAAFYTDTNGIGAFISIVVASIFLSLVSIVIAYVFLTLLGKVFGAIAIVFAIVCICVLAIVDTLMGGTFSKALGGVFASVPAFLSGYIAWWALKGDEKFGLVRRMGIACAAVGGTTFRGADLTGANFTKATLKNTDFTNTWRKDAQGKPQACETILEWVCWHDAKQLDRTRVGNSILANPAVRELLVTRNGYKKSYINANFRASNLNGVNLEQANLTWADLSCAHLRHANLKNANLLEALALDTDFTGATLTGACLEAWNIDSNTNLEQVDCQYVFLLRNQQERRPSGDDFAPGDFTNLFSRGTEHI